MALIDILIIKDRWFHIHIKNLFLLYHHIKDKMFRSINICKQNNYLKKLRSSKVLSKKQNNFTKKMLEKNRPVQMVH